MAFGASSGVLMPATLPPPLGFVEPPTGRESGQPISAGRGSMEVHGLWQRAKV